MHVDKGRIPVQASVGLGAFDEFPSALLAEVFSVRGFVETRCSVALEDGDDWCWQVVGEVIDEVVSTVLDTAAGSTDMALSAIDVLPLSDSVS